MAIAQVFFFLNSVLKVMSKSNRPSFLLFTFYFICVCVCAPPVHRYPQKPEDDGAGVTAAVSCCPV